MPARCRCDRRTTSRLRAVIEKGISNGGGQPLIQTGYRFWLERADALNDKGREELSVMHLTCLGILAEPAQAYPPTIR